MAIRKRGNPNLMLQKDWEVIESDDGTLRATLLYDGARDRANSAPLIGDRIFTGQPLYCYERSNRYKALDKIGIQCDFLGLKRDPTPFKVDFPGGSGTDDITTHPNFAIFAGTPDNPKNGAEFDQDTGEFVGFTEGRKRGVRSYIVPDVRVNLNYWTFYTPQARRITKEIRYNLPGVVSSSTTLNYLLIGMPYRQVGKAYQVTEQWLGSGPRGWDQDIY